MGQYKRGRNDGAGGRPGGKDGNKKRRWGDPSRVTSIPENSRGILISCFTGKENQAGREAINIITAAYETLAPPSDQPSEDETAADAGPSKDISSLLAEEVAELKDKKNQLFTSHYMGIGSLCYIQFHTKDGPTPGEIVVHICRQAKETKQNNTRLVTRFYPIDETCPANLEQMDVLAKKLAAKYFPSDQEECINFSVEFDKRAADPKLERMEVINTFARAVAQPPHKVFLNDPRKTIMVNVVKGTCGVSVVEDYKVLNKFNVKNIAQQEDGDKEKEEEVKPADEEKKEETDAEVAADGE